MIEHLDRTRPFGQVSGWQPQHTDRPVAFEQDNKFYDIHGRLIVPGQPLDLKEVEADQARARAEVEAEASAREAEEAGDRAQEDAATRAREREKGADARQKAQASPSVISPPEQRPGLDRLAAYEWAGVYLDTNGREILPGEPLSPERLAELQAQEADAEGLTIEEVIAQAQTAPLNVTLAASRALLGKQCSRSLSQMVAQLRLLARRQRNLKVPRVRPAGL